MLIKQSQTKKLLMLSLYLYEIFGLGKTTETEGTSLISKGRQKHWEQMQVISHIRGKKFNLITCIQSFPPPSLYAYLSVCLFCVCIYLEPSFFYDLNNYFHQYKGIPNNKHHHYKRAKKKKEMKRKEKTCRFKRVKIHSM